MEEFISEPLTPLGGFDTAAMASGLPGLPRGFTWRDTDYEVRATLSAWKASAPEGGRPGGERYLRRHYFQLHMSDDSIWTVYFVRQAARGRSPGDHPGRAAKLRWFLYSRTPARHDPPGMRHGGQADASVE
ncbi:MAG: DUF6504 family protein [Planctomycetota bacterium]